MIPSFVSAKYNPFDKLYFWHDVIDNSVISNATNNLFMAPISIIFLKQCTNYFTTHLPFLLPFSLARSPRSINEGVILLTVLNDFPICLAISSCLASGFVWRNLRIAISSKVQSKVSFWDFRVRLWVFDICISRLLSALFSPSRRFLKNLMRNTSPSILLLCKYKNFTANCTRSLS